MTLDDETAERIVNEAWDEVSAAPDARTAEHILVRAGYAARDAELERIARTVPWTGERIDAMRLVRAGYAARDAEVEELRAELDILRATEDGNLSAMRERAEKAEATLAKVREYIGPAENGPWHSTYRFDILAILDESPTERETPADREDVARVLRDADRPDVPAHLPPSRSYARMAAALMERFTITDGAHSSSVSITSPEVTTSDAVSGETPADEWEYGRAGRFVDDGTDARDDYWYGPRGAAEANISLLNEQEGVEPFDTRIEYRLVRRRKAGPREEVVPDDRA